MGTCWGGRDAGGRCRMSGYVMEDLAGLRVVALWICLFVCFPTVVSTKLHCKGLVLFFSI